MLNINIIAKWDGSNMKNSTKSQLQSSKQKTNLVELKRNIQMYKHFVEKVSQLL